MVGCLPTKRGMELFLNVFPLPASQRHHSFYSSREPRASSSLSIRATGSKGFGEILRKAERTIGSKKDAALPPSKGFGNKLPKNEEKDASSDMRVCPCGGGEAKLAYSDCCRPLHSETVPARDGLSVLKARFSAYARGLIEYIMKTTHPDNPDAGDDLLPKVHATCERFKFYKLEILNYELVNDNESYVTFRATYGPGSGAKGDRKVMEEKSYFVREDDKWLFRDGYPLNQA